MTTTGARVERMWEIVEKLSAIGRRETSPLLGGFAALSLVVKVARIVRPRVDPYDVIQLLLTQLESKSGPVPSSEECRRRWESTTLPKLDPEVLRRVGGLFLDASIVSEGPAGCVLALVLLGREAFHVPGVFVVLDWMRAHPSEVDAMGLSDEEIETQIVRVKVSN